MKTVQFNGFLTDSNVFCPQLVFFLFFCVLCVCAVKSDAGLSYKACCCVQSLILSKRDTVSDSRCLVGELLSLLPLPLQSS